jgi:hypothetical protein
MSIFKLIYNFFHAFFEILSFKIKPKFDKDHDNNSNDYDYEFIKGLNETMTR